MTSLRKLGLTLACLFAIAAILPRAEALIPGEFCVGVDGIKGMGSSPQSQLFTQHFVPKFEAACPEGVGAVLYDPLGDAVAVDHIVHHNRGTAAEPYLIFASDLPMTTVEKNSAEWDIYHPFRPKTASFVNHFPMYVFGVAIGYNLGYCEVGQPLKLTARTLSLIYSGVITTWNDPLLTTGDPSTTNDDNAFLSSCAMNINAARRDDEASSTIVFKDFMSQGNPIFNIYKTKELNRVWPQTLPLGCRGRQDLGMSTCLATPGTIGYVLYQEAYNQPYSIAHVANVSGQFVAPATTVSPLSSRLGWPDQCLPAAQSAALGTFSVGGSGTQGDWSRTSLTATSNGYPICGFGYWLAYQRPVWALIDIASTHVRTVVDFLTVSAQDATQNELSSMHVSPIPPNVRTVVRAGINNISNT